jgi:hypothetical protein
MRGPEPQMRAMRFAERLPLFSAEKILSKFLPGACFVNLPEKIQEENKRTYPPKPGFSIILVKEGCSVFKNQSFEKPVPTYLIAVHWF